MTLFDLILIFMNIGWIIAFWQSQITIKNLWKAIHIYRVRESRH